MMKSTFLSATFLAATLTLGGIVGANAQDATGDPDTAMRTALETGDATDTTVVRADFRGEHGARDGERNGHGPRDGHGMGAGMRGGMMGGMGGMMQTYLDGVDADSDGAITTEEIAAFRDAQVEATDTSGDGAISLDEFEGLFAELARERMVDAFQHLDADGDGAISDAELTTQIDRMVERMDRNEDGVIDAADRPIRGERG